jgi:hypothetical protein
MSKQVCMNPSLEVSLYMYGESLKTQKSTVKPATNLLQFCCRLQAAGQEVSTSVQLCLAVSLKSVKVQIHEIC